MEDNEPLFFIDPKRKPELEEGIQVDEQIISQTHTLDLVKKINKQIYTQTIVSNKKVTYLISRKEIHCGFLFNWQEYLNYLTNKSDWKDALVLGLNIYTGI